MRSILLLLLSLPLAAQYSPPGGGGSPTGAAGGVLAGTYPNPGMAAGAAVANVGFTPLNPASNLSDVATPATALSNLSGVPASRTVAGHALSGNVTVACGDLSNGGTACTATAPTGSIVGTTDTQTLTNKTVNGLSPTVFPSLSTAVIATRYTLGVSGSNWTIATNGGAPVTGPAIATSKTQAITLFALAAKQKIEFAEFHTTTAFSATALTSLTATLGDSVGNGSGCTTTGCYISTAYNLRNAVSNVNFFDSVEFKSATLAGSNVQVNLSANQNLSLHPITGALDIVIFTAVMP